MMPKVTVAIPTYNRAKYIGEAIKSVLDQTYKDFELIICDNHSEDNTTEIVNSFSDPRIAYYVNPRNIGGANANRCIELSQGEYIYIMHSDDIMMPENLTKKVKVLDKNPNVGLVHSDYYRIDGKGNRIPGMCIFKYKRNCIIKGWDSFKELFINGNTICCPSVMVRKECYEKLGVYDITLLCTGDYEMWMRISLYYDIAYLAEPLIKRRYHESSDSQRYFNTKLYSSNNINGIREEYDAKINVYKNNVRKFPELKKLKNKAIYSHAILSLEEANEIYKNGKLKLSREYLKFALRLNIFVVKEKLFLKALIRNLLGLILGTKGEKVLRKIRNILVRIWHL